MERPLILIVDDESKIRRLLAPKFRTPKDSMCRRPPTVLKPLRVYHKSVEKPDLILLDLMRRRLTA